MEVDPKHRDEAKAILADVDGHLLADIRAMRHWATAGANPPVGVGRLNFALMTIALIGCERLGFLASRSADTAENRDQGGYIVEFINQFFPARHPFKRIAKILADAMRHELVHGFGARSTTAPFELGLYVDADPVRFCEVRDGESRQMLAINSVAFADSVLGAFSRFVRRIDSEPILVDSIIRNAALPFCTPKAVIAEWNHRVRGQQRKPSNLRVEPTAPNTATAPDARAPRLTRKR